MDDAMMALGDAAPAQAAKTKTAILVLGMHRSGTSALAGVLSILGCDLPRRLMPPSPSNEKGQFESHPVRKLNDAVLASAGTTWDSFAAIPPDWLDGAEARGFRDRAVDLLGEEFDGSRLFVLKDPRICRLVPFWTDALGRFDAAPTVAHIHRDPWEVAASLRRRNGLEVATGLLVWLRHVLDAEAATRDLPRRFTSYPRLLADWAGPAARLEDALDVRFPRSGGPVAAEAGQFLNAALRHVAAGDGDAERAAMPEWVARTHAVLERWAEGGEDPGDRPTLDRIRSEFGAAGLAFAPLDHEVRAARARAASLSSDLAGKAEVEGRLAAETARREAAEATRDAAEASRAAEARRFDVQGAELAERTLRLAKLERRLDDRFREVGELTRRLMDRETELLRKVATEAERRATRDREHLRLARDKIQGLRGRLERAARVQEGLEARADRDRHLLRAAREKLDVLRLRLRQAERARDALLSSTAWRVTGPLRRAVSAARRVRRGG